MSKNSNNHQSVTAQQYSRFVHSESPLSYDFEAYFGIREGLGKRRLRDGVLLNSYSFFMIFVKQSLPNRFINLNG